jgi:hypothetical protein
MNSAAEQHMLVGDEVARGERNHSDREASRDCHKYVVNGAAPHPLKIGRA